MSNFQHVGSFAKTFSKNSVSCLRQDINLHASQFSKFLDNSDAGLIVYWKVWELCSLMRVTKITYLHSYSGTSDFV